MLAEGALRDGEAPPEQWEDIAVRIEPVEAVEGLIADGSIAHALVLAAFQRFFAEVRGWPPHARVALDGAPRAWGLLSP